MAYSSGLCLQIKRTERVNGAIVLSDSDTSLSQPARVSGGACAAARAHTRVPLFSGLSSVRVGGGRGAPPSLTPPPRR